VRDALAHYPGGRDLGWAHLKTEEAALLRELGRLDEAMAAITPAVSIFSSEVVEEAATIELERRHVEAGIKLARAALLQLGETKGPRWESLVEAVERDARPRDWYRNVALVLLGKADLPSLRPLMEGMDAIEDVGWVQGMRAAHEGRAEEADAWFQVSLEGNHANNPPPAWAYSVESVWLQSHRSLASLERRGALLLPPRKPKGALLGS
jgi:hypothetical protein